MGQLTKHVNLLIHNYPDISRHVDHILSGKKSHIIEMYDEGLLIYKIVPDKYIKVNVMHVLPKHRGKGIGTTLLKVLRVLGRKYSLPITITVPTTDAEFIQWLLSNKFCAGQVFPDKYKKGIDMKLFNYWEGKWGKE